MGRAGVNPPPIKHLWEVNGNCSHSRLPRLLHPVSSSSERFVMYMDKKKSAFTYLRASLNTSQLLLYSLGGVLSFSAFLRHAYLSQ